MDVRRLLDRVLTLALDIAGFLASIGIIRRKHSSADAAQRSGQESHKYQFPAKNQ